MSNETVSRPMKYPYTFSAKIAQFPLKHYIKHSWLYRYYFIALGICVPIFYKIQTVAKSPENVAKFEEMKRKEAEIHHYYDS